MERDIYGLAAGVFPGRNNGQFNANPMPTAYPSAPSSTGPAPLANAFNTLDDAYNEVESACFRAEALADTLCGQTPENAVGGGTATGQIGPSGAFGSVYETASRIRWLAARTTAAINRIERELP